MQRRCAAFLFLLAPDTCFFIAILMNQPSQNDYRRASRRHASPQFEGDAYSSRWSRIRSRRIWRILGKAVCITVLAFLFSTWLVSPFTATTASLFSSPEQSDFQFSDIFVQVADNRPVAKHDNRIAILDIGNADREEIASALDVLAKGSPRSVGLDLLFADTTEYDAHLKASIEALPNVVLPVLVEQSAGNRFEVTEVSLGASGVYPPNSRCLKSVSYGAVNFPTEGGGENPRVRMYAVDFPLSADEKINSFPVALAAVSYPETARKVLSRGADKGMTDYASREFTIITIDELPDRLDEVKDKVVIVGALNDAYDMHPTPLNSYQAGAIINAYQLATVLDGVWYESAPRWLDYVCAVVVCFLIVMLCVTIQPKIRALLVRILQVVLLYMAVRIGYSLYIDHHILCNFSYTILMIAFGLFANDLWNGVTTLSGICIRKVKARLNKNKTPQIECEELS